MLRTAEAAHREGGVVMVESQGKEGPSEHARPLMPCKSGETEAQRAARP